MGEIIYHFSEASDITYFEPRLATPELGAVSLRQYSGISLLKSPPCGGEFPCASTVSGTLVAAPLLPTR